MESLLYVSMLNLKLLQKKDKLFLLEFVMCRFLLLFLVLITFSISTIASPKIKVNHKRGSDNIAQVQVKNETNSYLKCYVAINGHKKHFVIPPFAPSKWYKARHSKYNSKHFSVRCEYRQ